MIPTIHPYLWSEFFGECLFYFVLLGVVHLVAFVFGGFTVAAFSWRQRSVFIQRILHLLVFLSLLLVVGSFANGFWSCLVWGRLYYSTDYVLDFTPFWPITQAVIDMPFGDQRGQLFGVTLTQLQLVWSLFTVVTWGVTITLYRAIRHSRKFTHA